MYELELAFPVQMIDGGSVQMTRTVYVDRETFLPVRVLERVEGRIAVVTDYVVAERLPRTPANERLLRMSPHPGAKRITEGRL